MNLSRAAVEDQAERYEKLCAHYRMTPTRNNRGAARENGVVESGHGHFKRAMEDALMIPGSREFVGGSVPGVVSGVIGGPWLTQHRLGAPGKLSAYGNSTACSDYRGATAGVDVSLGIRTIRMSERMSRFASPRFPADGRLMARRGTRNVAPSSAQGRCWPGACGPPTVRRESTLPEPSVHQRRQPEVVRRGWMGISPKILAAKLVLFNP